jgi:hypothetical protein
MRLIRNTTPDGSCKYRLWDNRKQAWVEDDKPGEEHEFFVIMLKDRRANGALVAYANAAAGDDAEFAMDVRDLARRAGPYSPFCQDPD